MSVLFHLLWPLERVITALLAIGRVIAIAALAIMVCLILGQVFFRYVMDAAPNWTEEGARFGMLWMTGLMAPMAYRYGGFVSIDMLERALGRVASGLLTLSLLIVSLIVLCIFVEKGWNNHVFSLSGRGTSASLKLPLDWFGGERIKFRNSWAYASLVVSMGLIILVNIELILRQTITLFGRGDDLTPLAGESVRAD